MNLTTHIAVGSAVGLAVGNPVAGFFVGWASHHFIDAIPHSDPGSFGSNGTDWLDSKRSVVWTLVDIIIGLALLTVILLKSNLNIILLWSVIGSTWPDVIDNSPFWSERLRKVFPIKQFHQLHEVVHYTIKSGKYFWFGILTQLVVSAASIYYIVLKLS